MAVYPQFRRSFDFMKKMKDTVQNQLTTQEKTTMANLAAASYANYAGFSVPLAPNAEWLAAGITPSPRTIEGEWQDWCDVLHGAGLGIIFRPAFPGMEGIYNFQWKVGVNRYPAGTYTSVITNNDHASWCGIVYDWIVNNPDFWNDQGPYPDVFAFAPERTENIFNDSTSFLPSTGAGLQANYTDFFYQMNLVAAKAFLDIGKPDIIMGDTANNYSEPRSGWIQQTLFNNSAKIVVDYYLNYNGDGFTATQAVDDLLYLYNNRGNLRIAWQEYGPIQTFGQSDAARAADLQLLVDELWNRMVTTGKMEEMNFWTWWEGQNTSFLTKTGSGASAVYALNPMGEVAKQFYKDIYEQTVPPVAPTGLTLTTISSSQIDLTWTDNSTTEQGFKIERKTGAGGTYSQVGIVADGVTAFSDSGLAPNTEYYYRVRAYNAVGNSGYLTEQSAFTDIGQGVPLSLGSLFGSPLFGSSLYGGSAGADNTPPTITNITISALTHNSVTISWETSEPATTRVKYGLTSSYGTLTPYDQNLVTSHQVTITGLTPATLYHFQVQSADEAGNLAQSADDIFTTDYPPVPPPFIFNVQVLFTTLDTAKISWDTLQAATSQVQYGLTTGYGSETTEDTNEVTHHEVTITGLTTGTAYHFRVRSVEDTLGEQLSGDFLFVTEFEGDIPPIIFRKQWKLRANKTHFLMRAPKRKFKVRVPNN